MINTLAFDLDGPLTSLSKDLHWECLNLALADFGKYYVIDYESHLKQFDGLSTRLKLEKLSKERGLPLELHDKIWDLKQKYTEKILQEKIKRDIDLENTLKELKNKGYKLWCCTNSIRSTTKLVLKSLGIIEYFDGILTNEDVCQAKPHPNIYLKCMVDACSEPNNTLIIEDSIGGVKSAQASGAQLLIVKDRSEVTLENIMNRINEIDNGQNNKKKFPFNGRVLLLAAGAGSRFSQFYSYPKPIIDVLGKPMIGWVTDSIGLDCEYIYLFQKEHLDKFNIRQMVNLLTPNNKVIEVNGLTQGACCTALLSKDLINDDKPLIIANSDQWIEWDINEFLYLMNNSNVDGGILTFENSHPKWSYAQINNDGFVTRVEEKNPISNHATVGIYYFKHGKDFVKYAEQMINKNIRVKGEFYLCPTYQQFIEDGKKIKIYDVKKMEGMGDPESLQLFIDNHKNV